MDNDTQQALGSLKRLSFWQDYKMRGAIGIVLLLLSAFLLAQTVNSLKEFRYIGTTPTYNAITINGAGEVFAVPDIATFTFSVIEEAPDAASAQDEAARKMQSITAFIKEQGVEEKDIKTVGYNLYPRYEFREVSALPAIGGVSSIRIGRPPSERVLVGFELNQTIEVKVRDTGKAGQLLAGVSELGASSVSGLSFTIDDEEALKAEARGKAIADAKSKAEVLAEELDVRLVRVISYSEYGEPIYYARSIDAAAGLGGDSLGVPAASEEAVVPGGENRIVSNVSITYEIR